MRMKAFTLGDLKKIVKDLPDDTQLAFPMDPTRPGSLGASVNVIRITHAKHSYGDNNVIQFGQGPKDNLEIRELIGKNEWSTKTFEEVE